MSVADHYRRQFERGGRRITLERPVVNGTSVTVANVRARIRGATPDEIAGGIKSTDRKVMILAEDVPGSFRPLKQGDKVLVDGLRLTFGSRPDDQTHRDGELLLAYDGVVSGA